MTEERDIELLLGLIRLSGGSIEGRKRLQKMVCIMKHKDNIPFSFSFRPYFFGPYSQELSNVVETMVGANVLEEEPEFLAPGVVQYRYKLSNYGEKLAEKVLQKPENRGLDKTLGKISSNLNALPTLELVSISKKLDLSNG